MLAVDEKLIECNDRALQRCKGVAGTTSTGADLGEQLSLALEALEICIGKQDEAATCIEDHRAEQLQRRDRRAKDRQP